MKKPVKGQEGYIAAARSRRAVITALLLAAVFFVYFFARAYFGTNRNLFSILAAIGALPAGNSAVNLVMFMKARGCSPEAASRIRPEAEGIAGSYDLYLTSYDRNYDLSHAAAGEKSVCAFTEDPSLDCRTCAAHIREVLGKNGHPGIKAEVTRDLEHYLALLRQLKEQGIEEGQDPETPDELMSSLQAAAL